MRAADVARPAAVGVLLVWFALPFVPLLLWAGAQGWSPAGRSPDAWSLGTVADAWTADARAAMLRSLGLALSTALVATPLGALAARALATRRARAPRLVAALLVAPVALPLFAVVMGLNVVLLRLHVPAGLGVLLVLVAAAVPYTTYVVRAAYAGYDPTYEDEARTLGATPRSVTWRVRLPLLAPALASAAFLAFLVGWSDYVVTLVVGGGQLVTLPVLLASAASGTGNEATVASLALGALVPPGLLLGAALLLRRRLGRTPRRTSPSVPATTPALEGVS